VSDTDTADADYAGHRDRLRTRFLTVGADSLQDYEILEMLLFTALPRRDVKPLAKALLRSFGSLWCVFNASPDALRKAFPKMTDGTIAALTIVGAAALRMTRQEIMNKPVLRARAGITESGWWPWFDGVVPFRMEGVAV
jgi:DNA repair protein RadC